MIYRGGMQMERVISTPQNKCWVNTKKQVLSFHYERGYSEKEFKDRPSFLEFCHQLVSKNYSVQ